MLFCFDSQQPLTCLRDLRKHERVHIRMKHCGSCNVWFTTAETEKARILVNIGSPPGVRQPEQRLQKRPAHRPRHWERRRQHYTPARRPRGHAMTTFAPNVFSVAVS